MISAEGDDFRVRERRRKRFPVKKFSISGCHLFQCDGIVERRNRYISTVENTCKGRVWIQSSARID
jgi:hypothetical protein